MTVEDVESRVAPYKVSDAATATGLSTDTLYRYIKAKQLRAVRVGERTLLIPASEVRRLVGIDGSDK